VECRENPSLSPYSSGGTLALSVTWVPVIGAGMASRKVGTSTQELFDEARRDGWMIISMKNDWKTIFVWERHNVRLWVMLEKASALPLKGGILRGDEIVGYANNGHHVRVAAHCKRAANGLLSVCTGH
jgi:hypothetical protein